MHDLGHVIAVIRHSVNGRAKWTKFVRHSENGVLLLSIIITGVLGSEPGLSLFMITSAVTARSDVTSCTTER